MANVKVQTSTSGRRYVEIDEVIKRRLAQAKKSQNGNGQSEPASRRAAGEDKVKSAPISTPEKAGHATT